MRPCALAPLRSAPVHYRRTPTVIHTRACGTAAAPTAPGATSGQMATSTTGSGARVRGRAAAGARSPHAGARGTGTLGAGTRARGGAGASGAAPLLAAPLWVAPAHVHAPPIPYMHTGRMDGQGTFVWSTGERYDGGWKVGERRTSVRGARHGFSLSHYTPRATQPARIPYQTRTAPAPARAPGRPTGGPRARAGAVHVPRRRHVPRFLGGRQEARRRRRAPAGAAPAGRRRPGAAGRARRRRGRRRRARRARHAARGGRRRRPGGGRRGAGRGGGAARARRRARAAGRRPRHVAGGRDRRGRRRAGAPARPGNPSRQRAEQHTAGHDPRQGEAAAPRACSTSPHATHDVSARGSAPHALAPLPSNSALPQTPHQLATPGASSPQSCNVPTRCHPPPPKEYDHGRPVRQSLLHASEALAILGKPDRVKLHLHPPLRQSKKVRRMLTPIHIHELVRTLTLRGPCGCPNAGVALWLFAAGAAFDDAPSRPRARAADDDAPGPGCVQGQQQLRPDGGPAGRHKVRGRARRLEMRMRAGAPGCDELVEARRAPAEMRALPKASARTRPARAFCPSCKMLPRARRWSVTRTQAKADSLAPSSMLSSGPRPLPLPAAAFADKVVVPFPRAGSVDTPVHRASSDFEWRDYSPSVFRCGAGARAEARGPQGGARAGRAAAARFGMAARHI